MNEMKIAIAAALVISASMAGDAEAAKAPRIQFSQEQVDVQFVRGGAESTAYLERMREEFALDSVVATAADDYGRVRAMSKWVRSRWEHNGSNEPQKRDPISILHEAAEGKRFRCVEYAIVLAAALNAVDVPARVVSLKTADAETRKSGAGHVVAEAWLAERGKWIMVDGQFDVIPVLDGVPLNAVELQQAIARGERGLHVDSYSGGNAKRYVRWVAPYLYYFGTRIDGRYGTRTAPEELVLLPIGAKEITVFQRRFPLTDKIFTHSTAAFYTQPR
jgi:transglutaminase-like putative cysteine protease